MPDFSSEAHLWSVREDGFDAEGAGVSETLFALANGYVGTRGTLDEREPNASPGTFLSGVFEYHPLSYPEDGYGHPEQGQAIIGVADGTVIELEIDGRPVNLENTPQKRHERILDLRAGTLQREVHWSEAGPGSIRVKSTRMVSLSRRSITVIRYTVTAVDRSARVVVRSPLEVNRTALQVNNSDPRVGAALREPFRPCLNEEQATGGLLVHRTRGSGICVAAVVDHDVDMPDGGNISSACGHDDVLTTVVVDLAPGEQLTLVKYLSHAHSRQDPPAVVAAEVRGALAEARAVGWAGLLREQQEILDRFWADADVQIDGDPELQLALRFDLFQLLQASACLEGAPIGAKGLTGAGYSGHTFWDIEGFLAPALTLLQPESAAQLLRWRASTLDGAGRRSEILGLKGAAFPWRTIDGHEASAYWPASTAAVHLNADIARAFFHFAEATGIPLPEISGTDVLVGTARMWASIIHEDDDGRAHLFGVTGPDEYTGVVDDNVFTNLSAQHNLRTAAEACERHQPEADRLGVTASEISTWRSIADSFYVPYDTVRQVHPANEGFTTYREWDFDGRRDLYPIQEHAHYAKIYRRQVVKQADLVLALWWFPGSFTAEEAVRNLDYYEQRTVRDSSLSAAVQAVVCARAGHLSLALAYLREAALSDLRNVNGDTHRGAHLAALAGAWLALASGFGGLAIDGGRLSLAPRLPTELGRVAFRLRWRGRRVSVEIRGTETTLRLVDGTEPITVVVDGNSLELIPNEPLHVPLAEVLPSGTPPRQPPGREPRV
ncbi:family 65 glycosyl hydrolase [Arthrobacter sp. JZ12]|uniref:glycoside hydrolase family 65 protein n=1 Tax=Arthrobacter sp. JZ12 TaxID=2654190 RepID=UPI002B46FE13|nr:glycosyl hydrolase family 65 protein [Arthrobacter sp. JZ12]WRH25160.1 family 65 glycosyl hydrolase [Arthrobacter sp. JZ12]